MAFIVAVALSSFVGLPVVPQEAAAAKKTPVRVYTNDDLDRVSPLRDQTGVLMAAPPRVAAPASEGRPARGEEYWRREAERLRDRLEPLRARAQELRLRMEELRRRPPVGRQRAGEVRANDAQGEAARQRLHALESRIRELEATLEDRARREGALPGWLR